jgi:hypothetical protein
MTCSTCKDRYYCSTPCARLEEFLERNGIYNDDYGVNRYSKIININKLSKKIAEYAR